MATQIVLDRTGDSRYVFDPQDAKELTRAERRFRKLTDRGFTAAVRTAPGHISHVTAFDPAAEETLFFPRLVAG